MIDGIRSIMKESGIGGLYKGNVATVLINVSNMALRFTIFDDATRILNQYIPYKGLNDVLGGGIAGLVSLYMNNPVDVIKTRM